MTRTLGTQNKKVNTTWNEVLTDKYNALFNRFEKFGNKSNLVKETFLKDYRRELGTFIQDQVLSDSRKKDLFFMVGRWLAINKDSRYSKIFLQLGYDLMKKIAEEEKDGEQSAKEQEFYMSIDTLKFIMKNEKWQNINNNQPMHMQYLLMNLLIYQPVMRPDFYTTCMIINQKKQNDKINNYLLVNNKTKTMDFIVNRDKITKSRHHLDVIDIENKDVRELIRQSLKLYPREYLFEDDGNPYSYFKLSNALKKATGNNGIGFSMIRSAYVNDFYKHNKSVKLRELLAKKMRHSFTTALIHYNKIDIDTENNTQIECLDTKAKLHIVELQLKTVANKITPTEQAYKTIRANTLLKLNQRMSTPRQLTIDKYTLIYDDDAKKWL